MMAAGRKPTNKTTVILSRLPSTPETTVAVKTDRKITKPTAVSTRFRRAFRVACNRITELPFIVLGTSWWAKPA